LESTEFNDFILDNEDRFLFESLIVFELLFSIFSFFFTEFIEAELSVKTFDIDFFISSILDKSFFEVDFDFDFFVSS